MMKLHTLSLFFSVGLTAIIASPSAVLAQNHVEVFVRPLNQAILSSPPRRGSSSMRRTAEAVWERPRNEKTFVVQVEIHNPTNRSYILKVNKVTLRNESGGRTRPLEPDDGSPKPILKDQTVGPQQSAKGFLTFPAGAYTGARGSLLEEGTSANEGFSIDF